MHAKRATHKKPPQKHKTVTSMKRKALLFANGILASVMALLGFSSCGNTTRVECIYGGPDMMDKTMSQPKLDSVSADSLSIDTIKDAVIESNKPKPVMYGGPYSRFNSEPKTIQKEIQE